MGLVCGKQKTSSNFAKKGSIIVEAETKGSNNTIGYKINTNEIIDAPPKLLPITKMMNNALGSNIVESIELDIDEEGGIFQKPMEFFKE